MARPFLKMNGLGNDFVVVDARAAPFEPTLEEVRAIADRASGVGCDQLISIEPRAGSDGFMRIWNADGGEVEACGNAARCVAWLLTEGQRYSKVVIDTKGGELLAARLDPRTVRIDMGKPGLLWTQIPLAEDMDTRGIELQVGPIDNPVLHTPGCVNMGNPWVVFFVPDAEAAPVAQVGSMIEHHYLFPQGVNVGFAQIKAPDRIRLRVWERGVGITRACGTGACAAVVAASRRSLSRRHAVVEMDGGELDIDWAQDDGRVYMTGPVELEYEGVLP